MTRHRVRLFTLIALTLFGGCAALPEDAPVLEQLDTEMGATIARLGKPMELYRETFMSDPAGRFAFVAPFETNQMGTRELYLWVAVPVDLVPDSVPTVEVNGTALALGAPGREPDFAGVGKSPYRIPTPWSSMFYFKIDGSVVATLGDATALSLSVQETTKNGPVTTVFAAPVEAGDSRLRDFAAR
jgi:hypothetical protein